LLQPPVTPCGSDCSDELDNDGDDEIDCDDEDCAEDAACEEACDTADTSTDCEDAETTGSGAAPLAGELGGCGCSATPTPKLAGASVLLLLGSLLFARRRRIAPGR
jgi:MYXO-CTERM domain-containing protein